MKKIFGIFALLLFTIPAHSQFKVEKAKELIDYVLTQEKDTLWGEIRYGNHIFGSRLNKIVLISEDGTRKKFKANSVSGFYNDRHFYHTINLDGYWYFARMVVEGTVNMYFFEYAYASNYHRSFFSSKDQLGVNGKILTVLLERNGNIQRIFKSKFERDLFPFIGDNNEIMSSVMQGECTFDELEEVVMSYNSWATEK